MSKAKENDQPDEKPGDPVAENPSADNLPADNPPQDNPPPDDTPKDGGEEGSEFLTVEEHKKNLGIDAPVFAAVMQSKKWGSGKKVPKADFVKAVKDFLGAPMGGK
jgi:hypothetical protein